MSDDDLPPRRERPGAPNFIWLVIGLILVVGFILVVRALHPSLIGVGPSPPPPPLALPKEG